MTEKKREKTLQNAVFLLSKWTLKFLGSAATAPQKRGKIKNRNCRFLVLSKDPHSTTETNPAMFLQI